MLAENPAAGAKILVVDDAPQNVKLLRLILKDAGYQVAEAYSGQEAMDKLRSDRPDAMVLDVRMPGMTGYEVCEAVRRDPEFAALPVIMVTALSLPEERIKGIQAGATDFITKPFIKKELLARIQSSLALAQAGRPGILQQLPGSVVIATPGWQTLAMSPMAAAVLDVASGDILGQDLLHLLQRLGVDTPDPDAPCSAEPWMFDVPAGDTRPALTGRHTPVTDAAGRVVLRLVVLSDGTSPGPA
jgi:CheY-like chemotaxis protein